jgi:hypothetical protein
MGSVQYELRTIHAYGKEQINMKTSSLAVYAYWLDRMYHKDTRLLAMTAMFMLSINPSEASVERSFSAQKFVHSALRNRLHADVIDAQMFAKINAPLLTSSDHTWMDDIMNGWTPLDVEGAIETPAICGEWV